MRRAAHVLLHPKHALGGLDVETAGIEAHALADQRYPGSIRPGPKRKSISRGALALARPTAWIVG